MREYNYLQTETHQSKKKVNNCSETHETVTDTYINTLF